MNASQLLRLHDEPSHGFLHWFGWRLVAYALVPVAFAAVYVAGAALYARILQGGPTPASIATELPPEPMPLVVPKPQPVPQPGNEESVAGDKVYLSTRRPLLPPQILAIVAVVRNAGFDVFEFDRTWGNSFLNEIETDKGSIFVFSDDANLERLLKEKLPEARFSAQENASLARLEDAGLRIYEFTGNGVNTAAWRLILKAPDHRVFLFTTDAEAEESLKGTFKKVKE